MADGGSIPTGSCTEDICFDCGLIPVVTTRCGDTNTRPNPPTDVPAPTTAVPSAGPSASAIAACPAETDSLCLSSSRKLSCNSFGGLAYDLTCGIIVLGIQILEEVVNQFDKRVVATDLNSCLLACDVTAGCIAVNYVDTQCTLFSSVSGTTILPRAISAILVGANGGGAGSTTSTITSYNGECPPLTAGETGTRTVYNTFTVTSCAAQPICPNPGYVIIGGSATVPGGVVVTTTNGNGVPITYTQIQTSNIPITTTNSNGATIVVTQTAPPFYTNGPGNGPGMGPGVGPGTGPGSGPGE